ncbi:SPX domain-containing protein 1-like [Rhodamnia argentea]|uniref:SPX domain-containing protein 1-like n=1 Tax=Rhodamnia argentea TaxID=178133 RepID=A0A8B8R3K1_9MYRT|nr:SPX domain-containing protein 1-like [Rhodamnia argentea]
MKFGKSLSNQIEVTLPDWRDKFLSYKELKRRLKSIHPRPGERLSKRPRRADAYADSGCCCLEPMLAEEVEFVRLLEDELEKFNAFFVEKEEEYIIRLKELQDRVAKSEYISAEMIKIRKEIVDFHGEMVLLENYSALNYTGLVKILKKYDKRTGALIRLPFIQKVLQQPFFTTDLLYKLVKECESMLDHLFPNNETPDSSVVSDANELYDRTASTSNGNGNLFKVHKELPEIKPMESLYMKSTVSALRVLKEIRSKSSTVSVFSLPPLQIQGFDDT